ncbi:hypothetical protein GWI33_007116, partial [Rhynchophorus ferrugineus]
EGGRDARSRQGAVVKYDERGTLTSCEESPGTKQTSEVFEFSTRWWLFSVQE